MLLSEQCQMVTALQPDADRWNANPATTAFNMALYSHITFVIMEGAGGTGTVKIQVEECTSSAGAGNTAIPFKYRVCSTLDTWGALAAVTVAATGYTTTAGANKMVIVEVDSDELDVGYPWVRLQLTEVANDPCDAGVLAILSEARFPQSIQKTAIA